MFGYQNVGVFVLSNVEDLIPSKLDGCSNE